MPDYKITNHAMTRMSQRAVRSEYIELVLTSVERKSAPPSGS